MAKRVTTKQTRLTKIQKWLIATGCLLILGFLAILFFLFSPTQYPAGNGEYPLGDKLEYIGKQDYGCRVGCDSAPSSVLFYATDMTKEELKGYFRGAIYDKNLDSGGGGAEYNFKDISFSPLEGSRGFTLSLYSNKNILNNGSFKQTSKQNILSISFDSYPFAKENL